MADKKQDATQSKVPATAASSSSPRKVWKPKSTIDVVLQQIGKQEKKVAELEKALNVEKQALTKLQQARKVLEAT